MCNPNNRRDCAMRKKKNISVSKIETDRGTVNYSNTDPLGSYTGIPKDEDEVPVQDADDL